MSVSARGTSLLEAVFAMALASILTAAASRHAHRRLADLRRIRSTAIALTVARNLLEASVGAPCGDASSMVSCPDELVCSTNIRTFGVPVDDTLVSMSMVEVEISVRSTDAPPVARLATVMPTAIDCSGTR